MKTLRKMTFILSMAMTVMLWSCTEEADKEFVHDSNTISQMICKASHGTTEFIGKIYEYSKDATLVSEGGDKEFSQKDVEGGYGIIVFEIPAPYMSTVDLKNIYLVATLDWDQFVTPTLTGRHDITGDGIIITVKSGTGTKRSYRVMGSFE